MVKEGLKAGVGPSDELIEVSFAFGVFIIIILTAALEASHTHHGFLSMW